MFYTKYLLIINLTYYMKHFQTTKGSFSFPGHYDYNRLFNIYSTASTYFNSCFI